MMPYKNVPTTKRLAELNRDYAEACQVEPITADNLATRVRVLQEIMEERKKAIEKYYQENSGQKRKRPLPNAKA